MVTPVINPLLTPLAKERIAFLLHSEHWSKEEHEAYQLAQLKELLTYCDEHVPFYQQLFKKYRFDPRAVRAVNAIKALPFLTKKDIQSKYDEFIPQGIKKENLIHRSTGGSTGTPLTVYADLDFLARDKANTVYYMQIAGFNPFDFKSIRLYGDKIPQDLVSSKQFWFEKDNKLIVSCYHFAQEHFPLYVEAINRYQPDYIHSRASAIYPLSQYICQHPDALKINVGAVYLDGEFLNDAQRDVIEKAWGCRVYNIYGHTEGCTVGISCNHSRLLHFMPQVGILELLDDQGQEVTQEGAVGEMVVTGFNNRVFPLIRYRTFDMAINTQQKCACQRNYRMIKSLEGRMQDFVINKSAKAIPLAPAVFNYNDMDWQGIRQFQVEQQQVGVLNFKVVRETSCQESASSMKDRIIQAFNKIFNNTFDINLEFVDDIARTRIGKFRYLEQRLDVTRYLS